MEGWISIAIELVGLLIVGAGCVSKFSKLEQRMDQNEKRDEEERASNKEKFTELYNSRNQTSDNLIKLTANVEMLVQQMTSNFTALKDQMDLKFQNLQEDIRELKN